MIEDNYRHFLYTYNRFIAPVALTWSYCLMRNHFHFLVQIRDGNDTQFISKQFANLFSAYTLAFNAQQHRRGSLFIKNFKRKEIYSEDYLRKVVHYIHRNPVEAGLCESAGDYRYSSYTSILSKSPTKIVREEVLALFEDRSNFIFVHKKASDLDGIQI